MFPQIAKRKKKEFVIADRLCKDWEEVNKEVELRSKLALKKIPNAILHDFSKVCRIKSIPDFYANYFIAFSHRNPESTLTSVFQEEIDKILTHSSNYHKISTAFKERQDILHTIKDALIIVEGFMLMSQGKNIPLAAKGPIEELVKGCQTLEELRTLQKQKAQQLAQTIIKMRSNSIKIYNEVAAWRTYLQKLPKVEGGYLRKLRIIYPNQAINSLLLLFYDTQFLRQSVLRSQIHFSKEEDDPFFEKLGKNKKGGQIQNHLCQALKKDNTDYRQIVVKLKQEIPSDEADQQREKQQEKQRIEIEKAKQEKQKEQKIKALRQQKKVKNERYSSLRNIRVKKTEGSADRTGGFKTSKGTRSHKKIIDVDILLGNKKGEKQSPTKEDMKIIGVYQKGKIPVKSLHQGPLLPQKQELYNERRIWQKQIKEEQQQKQKIKRLLKQTQKKALLQTRQFEQKLKKYEQQVSKLKSRIDSAKVNKRPLVSSEKRRIGSKKNIKAVDSVLNVYGSVARQSSVGTSVALLSSKLEEEARTKRNLELQIKQLGKEKQKLQKTLERQSHKKSKQTELFQRRLDKYEEAIKKLKGESDTNKKVIRQLQQSKLNEESIANSKLKMYSSRKKQEELLKNKILQKMEMINKRQKSEESLERSVHYESGSSREEAARRKKQQIEDIYDTGEQQKIKPKHRPERSNESPQNSLLEQKLLEQSREKQNLEHQIKHLGREKQKLERSLERQSHKISKETANFQKKLQKYEQTIIRRSNINSLSKSRSITLLPGQALPQNLEIVKTKQTIQIVFEPGSKRKKKQPPNQELRQAQTRLKKLEKQRQILEKKLQMSAVGKDSHKKIYESRIQENEHRVDKFRDQLQKQKDRNHKLQQNIRQMRRSINNEFEVKINRQRIKFERQKEQLLRTIEKEKQQRYSKDKVLEEQMKFLKEMEKNQNELINMLNREKKQKKDKQQMLLEELEKKEQLMSLLQIEEIKKNIQRQVRRQLLENDEEEQNQSDIAFQERKAQMEEEIQRLRNDKDHEISELDEQNEKLRELITRIKGQQEQLLHAIKQNIELESEDEHDNSLLKNRTMSDNFKEKVPTQQKEEKQSVVVDREQLIEQLKNKSLLQMKSEEKQRQYYSDIENSSSYRDKEKIENIVEFYLKSPHQYPGQKSPKVEKEQKKHIAQELEHKARLIQQFQNELFSTKDLPSYVPQLKNDAIHNHLLILRDTYQDFEADALRRQLFPPLKQQEVYNQKELSVESEEPPIISIMDDVRDHAKKYSPKKKDEKNDKKNFLAINRMRLMLLEDNRKQKQREIIEEQSKKRIQRDIFDKNRKKREKHIQRKKEKQAEERAARLNRSKSRIQQQKPQKLKKRSRAPSERSQKSSLSKSDKLSENRSNISSASKHTSKSKPKSIVNRSKKSRSERGLSQSETQRDKNIHSDSQRPKNSELRAQKEEQEPVEAIQQEQVEHSLDVKEQQQLEKIQREMLKSDIKSIQSEVRSYISGEQQFRVYQQFINEDQMPTYIDKLLELSSEQLINLNGNTTLKEDYKEYCTISVLVAKNGKGIEIGIGLFHKQYETGEYICDFILAHKMVDFLNLVFNFSKFIYGNDRTAQKIQFIFDLQYVQDAQVIHHFLEFEKKCRRMGQVYVKPKNTKQRKYILKRVLFQQIEDKTGLISNPGLDIKIALKLFDTVMMQVNQGFENSYNIKYSSINLILAYYLSRHPDKLAEFRKNAQNQLYYRQVLVTALLFSKKELTIKQMNEKVLDKRGMLQQLAKIKNILDIVEVEQIEEMRLTLSDKLPATVKRCIIEVQHEQTNYLIVKPEEAVTKVQSSNSSQIAHFMNLIPKFKVMVIEAEEFLTMQRSNPELTAFFYIKHFIKNITEVQKQVYERVYIPQLAESSHLMAKDASKRIGGTILTEQSINIGWKDSLGNSLVFTPRHSDLVIQKPFLLAVLSGVVERAVQGSPLCVRLIE